MSQFIIKAAAPASPEFTKSDLARAIRKAKPLPDPVGKPVGKEAW